MVIKYSDIKADPEFRKKIKQLQGLIKAKNGEEPSINLLTKEILKAPAFVDVEKQILEKYNELYKEMIK